MEIVAFDTTWNKRGYLFMKKFNFSLRQKIICAFLVLGFLSAFTIGLFADYKSKSTVEETIGRVADNIAGSIVGEIDVEQFNSLKTPEDMNSPYYKELRSYLNSIRKATGLKYLYTMRETEDGKFIYVVDGEPLDSEDASLLGDEEKSEDMSNTQVKSFNGVEGYELGRTEEWGNLISAYAPIKDHAGRTIGVLGADFEANNVVDQLNKIKKELLIIVFLVIIIGIIISLFLSNLLVKPLKQLMTKAELVKSGDLTVRIDNNSSDEIGLLAEIFKEMISGISGITKEIQNSTEKVSENINYLYESFGETSKTTKEIAEVITEVATGSLKQSEGVGEVIELMDGVFNQVVKAVNHAQSVSASSDIALQNSEEASRLFKTSIQKVNSVNETIERTAAIIQEFGNKSEEISSFSQIISEITSQTNLLALNAAIEAARAGEQGNGFAVVAEEIRKLAEQSSKATVQINKIVSTIQNEISNAIKAIEDGVLQAREGVDAVNQVDIYFVDLKNSSDNASRSVSLIINAINSIENDCKRSMEKVRELACLSRKFSVGGQTAAASTEEHAAIIQQMESNLESIKKITGSLNIAVSKFKTK